jgi:hypothetical protein
MIAKNSPINKLSVTLFGIAHKTGLFVIGRYFLYPVELFFAVLLI